MVVPQERRATHRAARIMWISCVICLVAAAMAVAAALIAL